MQFLESLDDFHHAFHELSVSLVDIQTDLGNQRISQRELRKGKGRNSELADAEEPDAKLSDGNDTTPKLPNGDDAFCYDGYSVWPIFERDMDKGQSENGKSGFVLIAPTIPFVSGGKRCPALGTRDCLF